MCGVFCSVGFGVWGFLNEGRGMMFFGIWSSDT